MNKGRRFLALILGLAAIAMLLRPNSQFWPGALMGLSIGYFNLEVLYRRVGKSDPNDPGTSLRWMRAGTGVRFTAAALGVFVVMKYNMNALGYAAGLLIPQIIVTIICGLQDSSDGKG
ncbi:MAG TPA: ATP synthase subunit I [Verrucomicrobiae bacterium]|nr:ATP synthase subunit I [Verrucomicrobiae bacterium]